MTPSLPDRTIGPCVVCGEAEGPLTLLDAGWTHDERIDCLRGVVYRATHGSPPNRACLPGGDAKWEGYLLGVEEAARAAESWMRGHSDELSDKDGRDG